MLSPEGRTGEIISILARIKAGPDVAHLETVRVRKSGTVFPVSLTVSPIRDGGGIWTPLSDCFTEPAKAEKIYQLVFEKGMAVDYPLTMRHRDGTLTGVLYNASVYRDRGGEVLGVFAAARDVTQARQAFEATQRLAAIVENSDDAIVSSTLEGVITSWNPAAERLYGYSSQEIIGKSIQPVTPADRMRRDRAEARGAGSRASP